METPNNTAPAASSIPSIPATDRLTVPASAVFPDLEVAPAAPAKAAEPAQPAAPAKSNESVVPAKAAEPTAPVKPAEPAKPNEPTAPVKPAESAKPTEPTQPAAKDTKIKIGGKEYTQAELEQVLAAKAKEQPSASPAQPAPQPAAPKQPTAEEISKAETDWTTKFIADEKLSFAPSEEEVETILSGGKDSAALLAKKLTEVAAKAVMLARKTIYQDMNPVMADIQSKLQPLLGNAQEIEVAAARQQFFTTHPEFTSHSQTVEQVVAALAQRYPKEFSAMSREQQMAEVAAQTDRILQIEFKRWNPAATGTWRDAAKAPAADASATPLATAVPAATVPPAPAPATAAPAPRVQAPASNSPAAVPSGGVNKNWHKQVAESLVN